jgi:hypothetical protein
VLELDELDEEELTLGNVLELKEGAPRNICELDDEKDDGSGIDDKLTLEDEL